MVHRPTGLIMARKTIRVDMTQVRPRLPVVAPPLPSFGHPHPSPITSSHSRLRFGAERRRGEEARPVVCGGEDVLGEYHAQRCPGTTWLLHCHCPKRVVVGGLRLPMRRRGPALYCNPRVLCFVASGLVTNLGKRRSLCRCGRTPPATCPPLLPLLIIPHSLSTATVAWLLL